jgi:hypothetical protein
MPSSAESMHVNHVKISVKLIPVIIKINSYCFALIIYYIKKNMIIFLFIQAISWHEFEL